VDKKRTNTGIVYAKYNTINLFKGPGLGTRTRDSALGLRTGTPRTQIRMGGLDSSTAS